MTGPRPVSLYPETEQLDSLSQSARLGVQRAPDRAAKVLQLQGRTGLAPDLIERNFDQVSQEADRADFNAEEFRKKSPIVAQWMSEHPNHFAAAKDDLDQLGAIEGALTALKRGYSIGRSQSEEGRRGFASIERGGVMDPLEHRRMAALEEDIKREPGGRGFLTNVLYQGAKIYGQMTDAAQSALDVGYVGAAAGGVAGLLGGPASPVTVPAGITGGFTVGLTTGFANYTYQVEAGQAYLELSKIRSKDGGAPLSETSKQNAALAVGVLNAALETVGAHIVAAPFKAAAGRFVRESARDMLIRPTMQRAFVEFGKAYGAAIAGETSTEVLQEMTNVAAEELAKMASNGQFATVMNDPEQRELAMQRLLDVATQTATGMLLVGLPGASVNVASDVMAARRATERENYYRALGEGVTNSKTFERLPEATQEIIRRATADGPVSTAYIDLPAFQEYFQSKGDPREAARQLWGNTTEYDQAMQTGAALALPMETFATRIAPDPEALKFFAREIRRAPDEINAREGEELLKSAQERAQEAATAAESDPRSDLEREVSERLAATGRYRAADAAVMAQQMAAFFTATGERTGHDPIALFNRYGLDISAPDETRRFVPTDVEAMAERRAMRDEETRALYTLAPEERDWNAKSPGNEYVYARTAGGTLRANLKAVSTAGLLDEYVRAIQANADDANLAVPTLTPDENFHTSSTGKPHVGMRGDAVNASGRMAQRQKTIAKLEAELTRRGVSTTSREISDLLATEEDPTDFSFEQGARAVPTWRTPLDAYVASGGTQAQWVAAVDAALAVGLPVPPKLLPDWQAARLEEARLAGAEGAARFEAEREARAAEAVQRARTEPFPTTYHQARIDVEAQLQALKERMARGEVPLQQIREITNITPPENVEIQAIELLDLIKRSKKNGKLSIASVPTHDAVLAWLSGSSAEVAQHYLERTKGDGEKALSALDKDRVTIGTVGFYFDKNFTGLATNRDGFERMAMEAVGRIRSLTGMELDPEHQYAAGVAEGYAAAERDLGILFQKSGDAPRGRIRVGNQELSIELLQDADLSTFLHESGHAYLEILGDLATADIVPAQVSQDYTTILSWLGVENRDQIGRTQHEQFARGFEAYLREGKAPSAALRRAFNRFKLWLKALYTSINALDVTLTPEVREVFDRMFATDAEIAAAEAEARVVPLFTDAASAGMTEQQFENYRTTVEDANIRAREQLQTKLMREMMREQKQWWKDAREEVRSEVEGEVNGDPVYIALSNLQRGTQPDGTPLPEDTPAIKLDRADIVALKGPEYLKLLPGRGKYGVYVKEGGVPVEMAAERFGYSSADEFLQAISMAEKRELVIERETDARMQERYGDMRTDGSIADAAETAVMSEHRDTVIRAELRALRALERQVQPFIQADRALQRETQRAEQQRGRAILAGIPSESTLRELAEQRVGGLRSRDIAPHTFWVWARKARAEATKALAGKDYVAAANAMQSELLNLALYREAQRAREEIDGIVDYARKLSKPSTQQRLGKSGADYLEQVNGILERFDFRPITLAGIDRRASLASFIKRQEDAGLPINIPEDIQNEAFRKPWREMTFEELQGVVDVLKHLDHLSSLKNRLLKSEEKRQLQEAIAAAVTSIEEHAKKTKPRTLETRLAGDEKLRTIDSFFASHRKYASIIREMDGFVDGGALWQLLVRPLNEAGDDIGILRREMGTALHALFEQRYSKEDMLKMYTKEYQPPLHGSITKMGRLMMALNWGTEDNRAKLVAGLNISAGRELTASNVEAVLDTLDARDWAFVQGVWDFIGSYWPQLSALAERLDGIPPEKVEAATVTNRHGQFAGGYFPLKYDDRQSNIAYQHMVSRQADAIKRGAAARNSTKAGARIERVSGVQRPLRLDFGVITEHLEEIAMDITHTEALIDVGRVLGADEVATAIRDHYGDVTYKELLKTQEDIAAGERGAQNAFEKAINWLRVGSSVVGLGWNLTTAALQPLGLTQSMVRIGPKWVAKGISRWIRDAATMQNSLAWIQEKSAFMKTRTDTQMREIAEIRSKIGLASGRAGLYADYMLDKATLGKLDIADIEDSYFWLISRMQLVADIPTWLGGYEKAMASGVDEATAVKLADQGVIDAQGGGMVKDLASIQRGGPLLKLWTNFYSFFNTTWNLHAEAFAKADFKKPASIGRLAVDLLLLSVVPATLGYYLRHGLKGDNDKDKTKSLIREELSYLFGMIMGVREFSSLVQGYKGYEGPAGARGFAAIGKFVEQVQQGEADKAFWRTLNQSAGILFHYPAAQVQRTVEGFQAYTEGRTGNPLAVLFGPPRANTR